MHGQSVVENTKFNPVIKDPLSYYHQFTSVKPSKPYTHLTYTRPNNQLMSWPNYPSTAEGVMRRFEQNGRDNDVKNIVAKDLLKSLFSKKKKIAVIPKY
jgi:hypothetical protein